MTPQQPGARPEPLHPNPKASLQEAGAEHLWKASTHFSERNCEARRVTRRWRPLESALQHTRALHLPALPAVTSEAFGGPVKGTAMQLGKLETQAPKYHSGTST